MKARKSILLSLLLGLLLFFTVQAQEGAPTISDIQNQATNEDTATGAINFTVGDLETLPGVLVVTGSSNNQTLVPDTNIHPDGTGENRTVTITPAENQNGTATITLTVTDEDELSSSDTFDLTVTSLNDPPECTDVALTTNEDTNGATDPSCIDVDGNGLNYSIVTQPIHGTASTSPTQLLYDPSDNYNGGDTFTYKANDGTADSNTANVNVTVSPVNDLPVAQDQSVTTAEDTAKAITLVAIDVDGDSLVYTIVDQPQKGDLSGTAPNLTYQPDSNYNGPDSFTFKANDETGDSNLATITITVTPINDLPTNITLTGSHTVEEMIEPPVVIGTFTTTDVDGGPTYTYSLVSEIGCNSSDNASFTISGDSLSSTVVFDFETKPDTKKICVRTNDGNGGTFHKSFTINILDKPKGSITVTPITSLTTESGGEASFSMVLDFRPTENVNVSSSSGDSTEGVVLQPTTLTFTTVNWKIPQVVTVKGVDDSLADGTQTYTITTALAVSADPDYSGVNPIDVVMQNSDNDTAGLTVAPLTGLITTEGKTSAMIQVKLNTQPTADVTLNFSSSKPTEGTVAPASLVIKPADWNLVKEVTITGVDDKVPDGNQNYQINITTESSDGNYNNKQTSVSATNWDAPTVMWSAPVLTGQIYEISNLVPFLLKVLEDGSEPITRVRFYRWDAVKETHVNIGEILNPPYQIIYDPAKNGNLLNPEFNQFFTVAYNAANVASENIHIWVYKQGNTRTVYLPIAVQNR